MQVCSICKEIVPVDQGCARSDCPIKASTNASAATPKIEPGPTRTADRVVQTALDGASFAKRLTTRNGVLAVFSLLALSLALAIAPWSKIYLELFDFKMRSVSFTGTPENQNPFELYNIALQYQDREPDLEKLEQEILQIPWVENVTITVDHPDQLNIDLTQSHDLTRVNLPRIIGVAPEYNVNELKRVIWFSGHLRNKVISAEWVGNRRWNITVDTSQVLMLPETDPVSAMIAFRNLDIDNELIGNRAKAYDMRMYYGESPRLVILE